MFSEEERKRATEFLEAFRKMGFMVATAESCTGGLVAGCLTEIPGSSDVVDRGFVTYTNEAKSEMLGVPPALIAEHGAVSAEVAVAMAEGALDRSRADVTVSITGVAGPGQSERKPAGLVFMASARKGHETVVIKNNFTGDRSDVRAASVRAALELALKLAEA